MSKIYKKWRDLVIDPFSINFKKIKLEKIISYPPAGNDVIECRCIFNDQTIKAFIKIERSKMANFATEVKHLKILNHLDYCSLVPQIYEIGVIDNKSYIVLECMNGDRLSDLLHSNKNISKDEYLFKYGMSLARLHSLPTAKFKVAKKRIINDIPSKDNYDIDDFISSIIKYLKENKPKFDNNTFIHGDFHYANILWKDSEVSGILDWEYSGKGFKEQDIAWACVLRPTQHFMDNINDIETFIKGYLEIGTFDCKKFKWCLLNAYCHFYLMNIDNGKYIKKLKKLILNVYNNQIDC